MANKLSLMPNISIPRSRFKQTFNHSLDMMHGDLVPVDCFEVVPGDEFSYELASLIRMSTPIVPIMGNIKCYLHAFFVPLRLIWDDAEKFYGDPSNHDTISSIQPVNPSNVTIPNVPNSSYTWYSANSPRFIPFVRSVQDYLGKQDLKYIVDQISVTELNQFLTKYNISTLKERAYLVIWNDAFRPSLMVPPVLVNKTSGPLANALYGTATFLGNDGNLMYPFKPLKGFKQYDYFTSCTMSPQFGTSVTLPLGSLAPVGAFARVTDEMAAPYNLNIRRDDVVAGQFYKAQVNSSDTTTFGSNYVYADLSQATAATINTIRYAFQLQKYFERSNYGSRYFEILNAHYGITNPDSRLQRAERLGSHEFYINISQVVSTADTVVGDNGQNIGHTGAVSVTGDKCHLFTKSFSEPGYIMVLATTKYDRSYSSGWLREDLKKDRLEFWSPEFSHLGDQLVKDIELQSINGSTQIPDPTSGFGYQEFGAEYRYRKDIVSGTLRPGQNFDIWTLADDFDHCDIVNGYDMLVEDRRSLSRVLSSKDLGPDYICDFHSNIIATREMPLYSIPGLIDHFGAL